MKYFLYILLCDQKTFYVGVTSNLQKRINDHKSKSSFFTKKFFEIELGHKEEYETLTEVRRREKQIKGWSKAKKKALIEDKSDLLKQLSKSTELVDVPLG